MCGIAGFHLFKNKNFNLEKNIDNMLLKLKHRGPNNTSFWKDDIKNLFLGHTRLSIIDLSNNANQPMMSLCGRYLLTFNGEIYNFNDLKIKYLSDKELKTNSDTEVLLELIVKFDVEKTCQLINGMFAFAVYDLKKKKLFLSRDRLGEKPLYYYLDNNSFIFASEIKAILSNELFNKEINLNNLNQYFKYGYLLKSNSIFKNINKLDPGAFITYSLENNSIKKRTYWRYKNNYHKLNENHTINHYSNILENKLVKTIDKQRIADVPIGAFLSGGIDSSLIVSILSKISKNKLNTFTIGFNDKRLDESNYAKEIADYLDTNHHELMVTNNDLIDTVSKISDVYDEPFSDSSQIPTILLSQMTREQVTVSLSGDGGDELFGGYSRYVWANKIINLNFVLKLMLSSFINTFDDKRIDTLYGYISKFIPKKYNFKMPSDKMKKLEQIIKLKNINDIYIRLLSIWNEEDNLLKNFNIDNEPSNIVNQEDMMENDISSYLPDDLLVKIDRASMFFSLETRSPYLDHEIVEYSSQIPLAYKIKGNNQKIILKKILKNYIPKNLFDRPKMGFEVPIDEWIRGPLKDFTYDNLNTLKKSNVVDLNFKIIENKIKEHMNREKNWHYQIWNLIVFQQWCNKYL